MRTYETSGWTKNAAPVSFENGCDPASRRAVFDIVKMDFSADTAAALVAKLVKFFPGSAADVDSCGENGRVDVCREENDFAEEPLAAEWKEFKAGKRDLWYATYTFYVERVYRTAVSLSIARDAEA